VERVLNCADDGFVCGGESDEFRLGGVTRKRPGRRDIQSTWEIAVRKPLWVVVGVVLVLLGALFGLQGLNVVHGSGMSGKTFWAVAGPIIALLGLGLVGAGVRRAPR
jgi:hypothetical protein